MVGETLPLFPLEIDGAAIAGTEEGPSAGIARSRVIRGDALSVLRTLPEDSIQCCVTSPPYWGLRDYAVENQIGAEPALADYIDNLGAICEEVRRVLRPDGTFWLNIGDSYTSGGRTWRAPDRKNGARAMSYRPQTPPGLKPKDLIGVPWRVAFALQDRGWFLRSDIVWYKPNCQPESVKDRPTQAHEYLFLLTKSAFYRYHNEAIREPREDGRGLRNKRTVWCVKTTPFPMAHFATFPPELVNPCILAGSDPGDMVLDPFFGAGTVGLVSRRLGRPFVGIELKQEYAELAATRLGWPADRIEVHCAGE
jgi:site-specific DNA-methyltransferase (cytosine-N4-specific)